MAVAWWLVLARSNTRNALKVETLLPFLLCPGNRERTTYDCIALTLPQLRRSKALILSIRLSLSLPPQPRHDLRTTTRKRTRIPDLNVPASSSRDKRRRPPSLPDMAIDTPSVTTHTACGPLLPLFPLYRTSARTPDGQPSFNLWSYNQTQTQSPKLSKRNKRPRRVLDLNQPPSDFRTRGSAARPSKSCSKTPKRTLVDSPLPLRAVCQSAVST
jgi:hypothetical protein